MALFDVMLAKKLSGGGGGSGAIDMTLNGVTAQTGQYTVELGIYAISPANGQPAKHVKSIELSGGMSFDITYEDDTFASMSCEVDAETGDARLFYSDETTSGDFTGSVLFGFLYGSDTSNMQAIIEEYCTAFDPIG